MNNNQKKQKKYNNLNKKKLNIRWNRLLKEIENITPFSKNC